MKFSGSFKCLQRNCQSFYAILKRQASANAFTRLHRIVNFGFCRLIITKYRRVIVSAQHTTAVTFVPNTAIVESDYGAVCLVSKHHSMAHVSCLPRLVHGCTQSVLSTCHTFKICVTFVLNFDVTQITLREHQQRC